MESLTKPDRKEKGIDNIICWSLTNVMKLSQYAS